MAKITFVKLININENGGNTLLSATDILYGCKNDLKFTQSIFYIMWALISIRINHCNEKVAHIARIFDVKHKNHKGFHGLFYTF